MTDTKNKRRQEEARARLAAARKAQAAQERRRRLLVAGGSTVAVVVVIVVLVVVGLLKSNTAKASAVKLASPQLVSKVTSVPAATSNAIGTGGSYPLITLKNQYPVTHFGYTGSKPLILYVGAEYCPFCAAERWAMIQALSRFGTFSNLHTLYSTEYHIPTFTFYGAKYTSRYITFQSVEMYSGKELGSGLYKPLQSLDTLQHKLFFKFDYGPYVKPSNGQDGGFFPFVDFNDRYIMSGSSYQPGDLLKLTQQQVAAQLADPNSDVAKNIDGAANLITAAICNVDRDTPANVCTAPGALAGMKELSHG